MNAVQTSRSAIGTLGALLAAVMSAGAFLFAFADPSSDMAFVAYVCALPLFVSGLGSGRADGLIACVVATLGIYLFGDMVLARGFVFLFGIPVAMLIFFSLRYRLDAEGTVHWYPEGRLLTAMMLYPIVVFLIANIAAMNVDGGLLSLSDQTLQHVLMTLEQAVKDNKIDPAEIENYNRGLEAMRDALPRLSRMVPAFLGCCWMIVIIVNGAVAQFTLRQQNWMLRAPFDLRAVQAPSWVMYAMAITGLVGAFAPDPYGYVGMTLCALLSFPLFFAGSAIVHLYAAKRKRPTWFLVFYYTLLSFLWPAVFVVLLGALDQSLNLRQRIAASTPTPSKL